MIDHQETDFILLKLIIMCRRSNKETVAVGLFVVNWFNLLRTLLVLCLAPTTKHKDLSNVCACHIPLPTLSLAQTTHDDTTTAIHTTAADQQSAALSG